MKYIKTYESFKISNDDEKIDEGIKDLTCGVLMALGTLMGGQAKAQVQEIAPDFKPTEKEIAYGQKIKNYLDKHADPNRTEVDTLYNFQSQDSVYQNFKGEDKELRKPELIKLQNTIQKKYYNKSGEYIGSEMTTTGEYDSGERYGNEEYVRYDKHKNKLGFNKSDEYRIDWDTRLGLDSIFHHKKTVDGETTMDYSDRTGSDYVFGGDYNELYKDEKHLRNELDTILQQVVKLNSDDSLASIREKIPELVDFESFVQDFMRKYPDIAKNYENKWGNDLTQDIHGIIQNVLMTKQYTPLKDRVEKED